MAEEKEILISKEGLDKLKKKLKDLEKNKMKEVAQRIAEAKELGDLSENAEYHEARNEQAFLAGQIRQLKYKIKHAKIIEKRGNSEQVEPGSTVTVKNNGDKFDFTIVGSDESDPLAGKISAESPTAQALMDKKVGEKVAVKTPGGEVEYEILGIK